jgi:hypothetical protein
VLSVVCVGAVLVGVVIAQTIPGTACPGDPVEVHGVLYSGSAPAAYPKGDGWAQGLSYRGVLDDNGVPALNAFGIPFRASHTVDENWGNAGDGWDPTLFAGGNKNSDLIGPGQSPWDWGPGGGSPQKNDLTNAYFHTRVDPLTGDRWVFVAAETRSINGDSHVDFEFNQAGVVRTGAINGLLIGMGPSGGRTIGDFLISVDFEQGGIHPVATVRVWNGSQFIPVEDPSAVFSATNLVDIPHGADGNWKHFAGDGAVVNVLTHLQFVDGAANLSALGIPIDPCNTDATFTAKTRSSSSWTADLKDFAIVHFPLEPAPELSVAGQSAACNGDTFTVSVQELTGLPNTAFHWTASGCGRIVSDPTGSSITVTADNVCACQLILSVTAIGGECAHTATSTITVEVGDGNAPQLSNRPPAVTVECDAIPLPPVLTAQDDCSDVDVTMDELEETGECVGEMVLRRAWTTNDECNNTTTHTQLVTVVDRVAPTMSGVPDHATVACDAIPQPAEVTAADNCSDAIVELAEQVTPGECIGDAVILRTWTATDSCGNATVDSQTMTVVDDVSPRLTNVPQDTDAQCDAIPAAAPVAATDNCSSPTVLLFEQNTPGECDGSEVITRTWTASDDCGNQASQRQVITVNDAAPPELFGVPADVVVECSAVPPPATVTATDNCSDPTVEMREETVAGPGAGKALITRTWTATDACGNAASRSQVIGVIDTTDPVLHGVPGDLTVECSAVPIPPQVTASDNCAVPTVRFQEEIVPGDCPGRWTIIRRWTAVDDCGNEATQQQTITVVDTTPPVLQGVPSDVSAECDAIPQPPTVAATDLCSNATVRLTESAQPGDCADESLITRTWTATDACGNQSRQAQVITVVDTKPPTLSGDPADVVVECDSVPNPARLTATDTCDDQVPVELSEARTPGRCPGEYRIDRTWSAADDCGNEQSVDQALTVQDTQPPTIAIVPNATQFICDGAPVEFVVRSQDNCSGVNLTLDSLEAITANNRDRVILTPMADGTFRIKALGPAFIRGAFISEDGCGNVNDDFQFSVSAKLGREACSQGFWRNHPERWGPTGFTPDMRFTDAFRITDFSSPEIPADFDENITLFEAANSTGGSFNQALLQGVAALLNAAHPELDFPATVSQVRMAMQAAFAGEISFDEARSFFTVRNGVERECGCDVE